MIETMVENNRILVGVIGAPHGVRGEMRLKSFTGDPTAIASYGALSTEDGRRTFSILSLRRIKEDMVVVRLKDVDDRAAAETLTNTRLYIDRASLPPTEEDEFYHADLIGLRAETSGGALVGHVTTMQNFGAGDLLEIAPARGETILVPFTKKFVPHVDLGGGRVILADEALPNDETAADAVQHLAD
jgi:16S rRNA processing protein RimM